MEAPSDYRLGNVMLLALHTGGCKPFAAAPTTADCGDCFPTARDNEDEYVPEFGFISKYSYVTKLLPIDFKYRK